MSHLGRLRGRTGGLIAAGGAALGDIRYFDKDPGAGWLLCDGLPLPNGVPVADPTYEPGEWTNHGNAMFPLFTGSVDKIAAKDGVYVGAKDNKIYVTTDPLTTWPSPIQHSSTYSYPLGIVYGNGRWVAAFRASSGNNVLFKYATDPFGTWTELIVSLLNGSSARSLSFQNGYFLVDISNSTVVLYQSDITATTWNTDWITPEAGMIAPKYLDGLWYTCSAGANSIAARADAVATSDFASIGSFPSHLSDARISLLPSFRGRLPLILRPASQIYRYCMIPPGTSSLSIASLAVMREVKSDFVAAYANDEIGMFLIFGYSSAVGGIVANAYRDLGGNFGQSVVVNANYTHYGCVIERDRVLLSVNQGLFSAPIRRVTPRLDSVGSSYAYMKVV